MRPLTTTNHLGNRIHGGSLINQLLLQCRVVRRGPLDLNLIMTSALASILTPDLELETRADQHFHAKFGFVITLSIVVPPMVFKPHVTWIKGCLHGTNAADAFVADGLGKLTRRQIGHVDLCAPGMMFETWGYLVAEAPALPFMDVDYFTLQIPSDFMHRQRSPFIAHLRDKPRHLTLGIPLFVELVQLDRLSLMLQRVVQLPADYAIAQWTSTCRHDLRTSP